MCCSNQTGMVTAAFTRRGLGRAGSLQAACAIVSAQLARPVVRLKLLAELVGPLLLDGGALLPRPPVHVLLGQAQQACKGMGGHGMVWHGMAYRMFDGPQQSMD